MEVKSINSRLDFPIKSIYWEFCERLLNDYRKEVDKDSGLLLAEEGFEPSRGTVSSTPPRGEEPSLSLCLMKSAGKK